MSNVQKDLMAAVVSTIMAVVFTLHGWGHHDAMVRVITMVVVPLAIAVTAFALFSAAMGEKEV